MENELKNCEKQMKEAQIVVKEYQVKSQRLAKDMEKLRQKNTELTASNASLQEKFKFYHKSHSIDVKSPTPKVHQIGEPHQPVSSPVCVDPFVFSKQRKTITCTRSRLALQLVANHDIFPVRRSLLMCSTRCPKASRHRRTKKLSHNHTVLWSEIHITWTARTSLTANECPTA